MQHHHYGHHGQVWCVHYLPSPDKTSTCYASPNHPFDFPGREQWTPTSMRDWRIFRYQIVLRWGAGKVHTDDHPYIPMAGIWAGQHYSSRAGIWPDQLHSSISWDPPNPLYHPNRQHGSPAPTFHNVLMFLAAKNKNMLIHPSMYFAVVFAFCLQNHLMEQLFATLRQNAPNHEGLLTSCKSYMDPLFFYVNHLKIWH